MKLEYININKNLTPYKIMASGHILIFNNTKYVTQLSRRSVYEQLDL